MRSSGCIAIYGLLTRSSLDFPSVDVTLDINIFLLLEIQIYTKATSIESRRR